MSDDMDWADWIKRSVGEEVLPLNQTRITKLVKDYLNEAIILFEQEDYADDHTITRSMLDTGDGYPNDTPITILEYLKEYVPNLIIGQKNHATLTNRLKLFLSS